jgi:hypothetical protein
MERSSGDQQDRVRWPTRRVDPGEPVAGLLAGNWWSAAVAGTGENRRNVRNKDVGSRLSCYRSQNQLRSEELRVGKILLELADETLT